MLTSLPWQLQAVLFENIMCLFISTYIFNQRATAPLRTRRYSMLWLVSDSVFGGLFLWGATQANLWTALVAGYFLLGVISHFTKMLHPETEPQPVVPETYIQRVTGENTSGEAVASAVGQYRVNATVLSAVFYFSIMLMVALGAA